MQARSTRLILIVAIANLFYDLGWGAIRPLVPLYARSLGADVGFFGIVAGFHSLGWVISGLPMGYVGDRFGRKNTLGLGFLLVCLLSVLMMVAGTPFFLLSIWTGFAVAGSAVRTAGGALVAEVADRGSMGRAFGLFSMVEGVGFSIGPALGGLLAEAYGFQIVFASVAASALAALGVLWMFMPQSAMPRSASGFKGAKVSVYTKPVLAFLLLLAIFGFASEILDSFFPLYAQSIGLSVSQIGLLYTLSWVGNFVGRYPSGSIFDRAGTPIRLIVFASAATSLLIAALSLSANLVALSLVMFAIGIARSMVLTGGRAYLGRSAPQGGLSKVMGGFATFFTGGRALSPVPAGWMIALYGFTTPFVSLSLAAVASSLLVYGLARRKEILK